MTFNAGEVYVNLTKGSYALKSESTYVWELRYSTVEKAEVIHVTQENMIKHLHAIGVLLIRLSQKGKWIPVLDKEQFKYVTHVGEPKNSVTIDMFWSKLWDMDLGNTWNFSDTLKIVCIQRPDKAIKPPKASFNVNVDVDIDDAYYTIKNASEKLTKHKAHKGKIEYHETEAIEYKNEYPAPFTQSEPEPLKVKIDTTSFLYHFVDIDNTRIVTLYADRKRYTVQFIFGEYHELPEEWPKDVKYYLKSVLPYEPYKKSTNGGGGVAEDMPSDPRFSISVKHPITKSMCALSSAVISLNDQHKWTREQIADWLDTLDDQPKFVFKGPTEEPQTPSYGVYPFTRVDEMQPT